MSEARRAMPQALAALGVIVSLIFVGLEIRQNTTAARGATVQAISDQAFEWTLSFAQDTDWVRVITFLNQGGRLADLSPEDQTRFQYGALSTIRIMENRYRQVQLGVIDASEIDVSGGRANVLWYQSPHFLDYWRSLDQTLRWAPDFVEFMETEVLSIR